MSFFASAAQEALLLLLAGLAGGRVHNDPPSVVTYPWLEIARAQLIPDDATATDGGSDAGVSDFFDLHIWSRYAGDREILELADQIHTLTHGAAISIAGRASAIAWVRGMRGVLRDPDGITRHGIVSIEIIHRS